MLTVILFKDAILGGKSEQSSLTMYYSIAMPRILVYIVACLLPLSVFGQQSRLIDEINEHTTGMAVWWAGHNSWLIKSGDELIATDLYLENGNRFEPAPITPEKLASVLDVSFVTHAPLGWRR